MDGFYNVSAAVRSGICLSNKIRLLNVEIYFYCAGIVIRLNAAVFGIVQGVR